MKKTFLFILCVLVVTPMLSSCCYYPYHYADRDGWYSGDYRQGRGYYYDRGNDDHRGGYRDSRERY